VILNDLPRAYFTTAALRNLQEWAIDGRAPPQAVPISMGGAKIGRDENGNALGGLRSPWIDAPTATYRGALGLGPLAIVGAKTPFTEEKLRQLYPTHADYVAKVKASVDALVAGRWLMPEDGAAIVRRAAEAPLP
jgi:hypothetical protein